MKKDKKSLAAVVGASIVTLSAGAANAAENPFAVKDLGNGYMQLAAAGTDQAKPKEMKCGAEVMKNNPEMKCGASMMNMNAPAPDKKAIESKCAGMKMDKPAGQPSTPPADSSKTTP